jgi:hypothetical protein
MMHTVVSRRGQTDRAFHILHVSEGVMLPERLDILQNWRFVLHHDGQTRIYPEVEILSLSQMGGSQEPIGKHPPPEK